MQKTFTVKEGYQYLLFLPENYLISGKNWPVVLYLHGLRECGNDLKLLRMRGIPKAVEDMKDFPFIAISPQCPKGERWLPDTLTALLDRIEEDHHVDAEKIYLAGITSGGYGAWRLAVENPERFAAIATACSGGIPDGAAAVRHLPAWVFHAAQSDVPISEAEEMVNALKENGGDVRFSVIQGDHTACDSPFHMQELYDWFLSHSRKVAPARV